LYEDQWAGNITRAELLTYLVDERGTIGYKVIIKAKAGKSYEQYLFWDTTKDQNGFSDNLLATFPEDLMVVNTRYMDSTALSVGNENNTLILQLITTEAVIYNDFVDRYEDWK